MLKNIICVHDILIEIKKEKKLKNDTLCGC